jgi:hypothetical protein
MIPKAIAARKSTVFPARAPERPRRRVYVIAITSARFESAVGEEVAAVRLEVLA